MESPTAVTPIKIRPITPVAAGTMEEEEEEKEAMGAVAVAAAMAVAVAETDGPQ